MSKKNIYISVFLILILLLFIYCYFAFYRTAAVKLETVEREKQAEETLVAALEANSGGSGIKGPSVATSSLQNKVPVKPMSDKLMLDFEKAELLSDSLITAIVFTEGEEETQPVSEEESNTDETPENPDTAADEENASEEEQANEPEEENITDGTEAETDAQEEPLPEETLPAGIGKIRAQLTIESPGFAEMNAFIDSVENQMRMIRVEQLEFTGPEEAEKIKGSNEPVTYNLTVAAYYMPELTDLFEDTPEVDAPDPANKQDPFAAIEE
ncbi:hypothetical protein RRU94_13735 [Domibacillus sp. DTU_2020_1001157_1_SI_ALB_TIR_016]|uniref:hypothetical protein n=1 Tax=Domibacillus sp. DTU_2020_1001157_1_SI_ALB_TIR_016 TaxID=3077789 RepID=UPI0028EFB67E|nr:hypothetical protein [Domibacillus sp. DTU_2020_1001157_1_SI_ALB_TIR_016]WNS81819.1 hypothetical protein RRU94_13735 [Domibacillus sp. DTU_2020_1001157_1_SI_ALB_TIR_016]